MAQTRTFGRRGGPERPRPPSRPARGRAEQEGATSGVNRRLLADWGKYAGIALLALVALAMIRNSGSEPATSTSVAAPAPAPAEPCGATLAEFYNLEIGMTYAAARDIIGCDGEILSQVSLGGTNSVMVSWNAQTAMFGSMNASFQNGQLVSRAQFRLK